MFFILLHILLSHTFLSCTNIPTFVAWLSKFAHPVALSPLHHPTVCPPSGHSHCFASLIPAYPLTLSTLSHRLSVSLPLTFLLKPISQFALSPFHPHWPSSPCLLIFNFVSDYFREVTSTCSLFFHLHPSPPSSP